ISGDGESDGGCTPGAVWVPGFCPSTIWCGSAVGVIGGATAPYGELEVRLLNRGAMYSAHSSASDSAVLLARPAIAPQMKLVGLAIWFIVNAPLSVPW